MRERKSTALGTDSEELVDARTRHDRRYRHRNSANRNSMNRSYDYNKPVYPNTNDHDE